MNDTPSVSPDDGDVLDETYTRMHATGPEFEGWLSNHGPMAADALIRLGCGEEVEAWVYASRLSPGRSASAPVGHRGGRVAGGDRRPLSAR